MPPREDNPTIGDDEALWRRIRPEWVHRNPDGTVRPMSVAFQDRLSGEVSFQRAALTTVEQVLKDHPHESIAEIRAGLIRSLGYAVSLDPNDPAHVLICPSPSKAHARLMAGQSRWAFLRVPPSAPSPSSG